MGPLSVNTGKVWQWSPEDNDSLAGLVAIQESLTVTGVHMGTVSIAHTAASGFALIRQTNE